MLGQSTAAAIMSLRAINPYISGTLLSGVTSGKHAVSITRQDAAGKAINALGLSHVVGCSAFAFQVFTRRIYI